MKKLFISQPMRGLKDEEILKAREEIRKKAEKEIGEPVELIDSFIKEYLGEINKSVPVYYLGKSIVFYLKQMLLTSVVTGRIQEAV